MALNEDQLRHTYHDLRDDRYWGRLLNEAFPNRTDFTKWECFGIKVDGKPICAWCYHSYMGSDSELRRNYEAEITMTSFTPDWRVRSSLKHLLSLFFYRPCYNRLTALVSIENRQACRLVKLAGFTLEGVIRKPDTKILQFSLLRSEWECGQCRL